jgi:hypothetical protein
MRIILGRVGPFKSLQTWSNHLLNFCMWYLNSPIRVLQKLYQISQFVGFWKERQNVETLKKIFSVWNCERSPHAEEIVYMSHSSGSSIIDTRRFQLLLCIHAQFQQSALVLPCSRCDRRKSVPKVGIQCFSLFLWTCQKNSKARENSKEDLNFLNTSSRLC